MLTFVPFQFPILFLNWLCPIKKLPAGQSALSPVPFWSRNGIATRIEWLDRRLLPVYVYIKPPKDILRRQMYKMFAEKKMFRCLVAVAGFTSVLQIYFHYPVAFANIELKPSYSVVGLIIFAVGYFHVKLNKPLDENGEKVFKIKQSDEGNKSSEPATTAAGRG